MTILKHRPHRDETALAAPSVRPTAVDAEPLHCKPGTALAVLAELRAFDAPIPPRAMHAAFGHGIPASATLRTVPLTVPPTAEETLAADAAAFTVARRDLDAIGDTIRHADPQQAAAIRAALTPIAEQLAVTL